MTDATTHASSRPLRLLKSWGGEAVAYDTAAGDTPYLKPLTLTLNQNCHGQRGYTSAVLAASLAIRLGMADTPQFHEQTEDAPASLRKVGLLDSA